MRTIVIQRSLSTRLLPDFDHVTSIEIEATPIAEGAFGAVHICRSVNGRALTKPQVIKLFKESTTKKQDHNFNIIQRLQKKLEAKNKEIVQASGKTLLEEYLGLKGVPQFSFEGTINGNSCRGFSANNLKSLGFEEFNDVLNEDALLKSYQMITLDNKMLIAYHLVSAFKLLQEFHFIHADLKPEAIFINTQTFECAIIDFDSGTITENADDKPNTWGAPNDWVAPEIWDQLSQSGKNGIQLIEVNLLSDLWSVAIGVHYILTTTHPLFYLKELSPRVTREYFKNYKWPEISPSENYFNSVNKQVYDIVVKWYKQVLPESIYKQLYNTVNYGYDTKTKRTTYREWQNVLLAVQQPPSITLFSISREKVLSGKSIVVDWEVDNATAVELSSIGKVEAKGSKEFKIIQQTVFKLTARNSFGSIEEVLTVDVLPAVVIKDFKLANSKVEFGIDNELSWDIDFAEKVQLYYNREWIDLRSRGVRPLRFEVDQTLQLKVTALDGKTIFYKELSVQVFKRVAINAFETNLDFVLESVPALLSWNVENATKIELWTDRKTAVEVTGQSQIEVFPKDLTKYELRASNELFNSSSSPIVINVQKLPVFSTQILPQLRMETVLIDSIDLGLEQHLEEYLELPQLEFSELVSDKKGFSLKKPLEAVLKWIDTYYEKKDS